MAPAPVRDRRDRRGLPLGWPRRTIQVRLAAFYFGAFLVSGIVLLAATVALWQRGSSVTASVAPVPGAGRPALPGVGPPQVAQHSADLHQLLVAAGTALVLLAVLSIAFGWLAAGHFLRPLRLITTTTREISASNLNARLCLEGPDDEIKELGDTFDDLLERLGQSFEAERRFVANASHELRTPLATMRASLDVATAKPGPLPQQMTVLAQRLRRELDQVDRLLDSFLSLAQAQRGSASDEAELSLDALVASSLARRSGAVAEMAIHVDHERSSEAFVCGSQTLLAQMVDNLADNAFKHNKRGGWVRLQTSVDGPLVRLAVDNSGAVLDQDEVNELARPFKRLGAERTGSEGGSGLGLSIVEAIAEAHQGVLHLYARSDGGLRVVVTLPRATGTEDGKRQ